MSGTLLRRFFNFVEYTFAALGGGDQITFHSHAVDDPGEGAESKNYGEPNEGKLFSGKKINRLTLRNGERDWLAELLQDPVSVNEHGHEVPSGTEPIENDFTALGGGYDVFDELVPLVPNLNPVSRNSSCVKGRCPSNRYAGRA